MQQQRNKINVKSRQQKILPKFQSKFSGNAYNLVELGSDGFATYFLDKTDPHHLVTHRTDEQWNNYQNFVANSKWKTEPPVPKQISQKVSDFVKQGSLPSTDNSAGTVLKEVVVKPELGNTTLTPKKSDFGTMSVKDNDLIVDGHRLVPVNSSNWINSANEVNGENKSAFKYSKDGNLTRTPFKKSVQEENPNYDYDWNAADFAGAIGTDFALNTVNDGYSRAINVLFNMQQPLGYGISKISPALKYLKVNPSGVKYANKYWGKIYDKALKGQLATAGARLTLDLGQKNHSNASLFTLMDDALDKYYNSDPNYNYDKDAPRSIKFLHQNLLGYEHHSKDDPHTTYTKNQKLNSAATILKTGINKALNFKPIRGIWRVAQGSDDITYLGGVGNGLFGNNDNVTFQGVGQLPGKWSKEIVQLFAGYDPNKVKQDAKNELKGTMESLGSGVGYGLEQMYDSLTSKKQTGGRIEYFKKGKKIKKNKKITHFRGLATDNGFMV